MKAENEAWGKNPDWLFCDTSLLVIEVWMEHRFGYCPEWIRTQIRSGPGYHLFLLTFPDLGWTPDPLREHPDLQIHFWNIFKQKLEDMEYLWLDIRGRGNLRLENSLKLIHQQLDRQT
jgi:nicotinamide riboside kinase